MIATHVTGWLCTSQGPPSSSKGGDEQPGSLEGVSLTTPILVIEDEAMIAWTLECQLEDLGFTDVRIVASGQDAIAAADRHRPGLIVSDINLGAGLDGVQTVVAIRAAKPIPVLFITGYASADTRSRIDHELPGAIVLRKPIQPNDLRDAVLGILRGRQLQ